ncbi:DUF2207 domain-containing protein [Pelagibacterium sediminicola]|uniref:DUF2207 domain-containing protein n=1 Tax=Pelagibacterium sediminicola TaxID=2248761 RepID=UPI000E3227E7|nr:DUF2207 domain-containing protein [Pelagibacterium sediminicola]
MLAFARCIAALAFALITLPAFGQEVIRNFETAIAVHEDASVRITETITVNAEGRDIRRGIFRDIPTVLLGEDGTRIHSELDVVSVTRNGNAEPYAVESIRDGVRIRIGDAGALLANGTHRYQIRYTMTRAARMFADHDELYWNATGNFWQFPIERATAVVTLPENAEIVDLNVFTGRQGATGSNARAERLSDHQARFTLTRPLGVYEGMTVAVAFGKGVLVAPEGLEGLKLWLSDNRNTLVPAGLLLIVLFYNFTAWMRVGRDPEKGVIFPRFHPPAKFSPALTHYVHRMGWRNSGWLAFSAALVSLATKGLIEIDKEGKKTVLLMTGKSPDAPLPSGEAAIHAYLRGKPRLVIDKSSGPSLDTTRENFLKALEDENRRVYFNNHIVFVVFGVLLTFASVALMTVMGILPFEFAFFAVFAAVFVSIFGTALRSIWQKQIFGKIIVLVVIGFIVSNSSFLLLHTFVFEWLSFPFLATVSLVAVTFIFGILMRAPTVHGRKVMDEIDGFKMYLETAEKERLNFQDEPEMTVTRFERILPYAMALGVEKPWSERFQADLARNAVKDARTGYAPHWYRGSSFSPATFSKSMAGIATGLSSAMIAAQPAKASSSGFSGGGGGGFSGGGGGGGGGGGW